MSTEQLIQSIGNFAGKVKGSIVQGDEDVVESLMAGFEEEALRLGLEEAVANPDVLTQIQAMIAASQPEHGTIGGVHYTKFPSGVIEYWGNALVTPPTGGGTGTVEIPLPFPLISIVNGQHSIVTGSNSTAPFSGVRETSGRMKDVSTVQVYLNRADNVTTNMFFMLKGRWK